MFHVFDCQGSSSRAYGKKSTWTKKIWNIPNRNIQKGSEQELADGSGMGRAKGQRWQRQADEEEVEEWETTEKRAKR